MIHWHMEISSIGGGVLTGTEGLLFIRWPHQLQHLCMTGPRRHAADRRVHAKLPTQYHGCDALFQHARGCDYRHFRNSLTRDLLSSKPNSQVQTPTGSGAKGTHQKEQLEISFR